MSDSRGKTMGRALSVIAAAALAAIGCGAGKLGGGTGGATGAAGDGAPCDLELYTGCGTGAGGDIATGGTGGAALCNQIEAAYTAAVTAALACTPGAVNQCQALVAVSPTSCPGLACGGQAYVNDDTSIESVRGMWLTTCSKEPWHSCPAVACDPPAPTSACVPNGPGAATGTCVPAGRNTDGGVPPGGESCDQIAADYAAAVSAARACTPGAPGQCQAVVNSIPSTCAPPGCDGNGYVNDATAVNAVFTRWLQQCATLEACPLIICAPLTVTCVPVASGDAGAATGLCTPVSPTF
jgi:hypothetical protein